MNLTNLFNEKFRKQFYLFTCILPDYVGHFISDQSLNQSAFSQYI